MRYFSLLILLLTASTGLRSQVALNFDPNIEPICDPTVLSGYQLQLPVSNDDGFFGSEYCDGTRENVIYMSFIAWTEDMEIQFAPSSCSSNISDNRRGIQVSVFTLNEENEVQVIEDLCECDDVVDDITLMLTNLIPGQQYYIFMDGCAGDVCDVSILLPLPTSNLPPYQIPANAGLTFLDETGEGVYCEDEEITVVLQNVPDGRFTFDYTIQEIFSDGTSVFEQVITTDTLIDTIKIDVDSIIYTLNLYNPCDSATNIRDTLVINRTEIQNFGSDTICVGDTLNLMNWMGQDLFQPIQYSDTIIQPTGCKLIQEFDLFNYPISVTTFDTTVCEFPVMYQGQLFTSPASNVRVTIENGDRNGCDSIISFSAVENLFDGEIIPISCDGASNELSFNINPSSEFDSLDYLWTVGTMSFDSTIISINAGEMAFLEIGVYFNGERCPKQFGPFQSTAVNFDGNFSYDCLNGMLDVLFTPDDPSIQVDYEWIVNGTEQFNNSPSIQVQQDDILVLVADVTNGGITCRFSFPEVQFFEQAALEAEITPLSCIDDTLILALNLLSGTADSIDYFWIQSGVVVSNAEEIVLPNDQVVDLEIIHYFNGLDCRYEYSYVFNNEINCDESCIPATVTLGAANNSFCWNGTDPISIPINVDVQSNMGLMGAGMWLNPEVDAMNNFNPTIALDSIYTLNYQYTEDINCIANESIEIEINMISTPNLSIVQDSLCINEVYQINADYGIGMINPIWDLSGANIVSGDLSSGGVIEISYDQAGDYYLFLSVENQSCQESIIDTLFLNVSEETALPQINCEAFSDEIVLSWTGSDCFNSYQVIGAGLDLMVEDTFLIIGNLMPDTDYNFNLIAFEDCACMQTLQQSFNCTTSNCPDANIQFEFEEIDLCETDQFSDLIQATHELQGDEVSTSWSGVGISETGFYNSNQLAVGTEYLYFNIEDQACSYQDSILVTRYKNPEFTFNLNVDSCLGSSGVNLQYQIVNSNGMGVMHLNGSPLNSDNEILDLDAGNYTLEWIDEQSCSSTQDFSINQLVVEDLVIDGPLQGLDSDTLNYSFNIAQFLNNNVSEVIWTVNGDIACQGTSCVEFDTQNNEDFELCLELFYGSGCNMQECIEVELRKEIRYYIPTAFSPGTSEGINDEWIFFSNEPNINISKLNIYDRWGNLLHDMVDGIQEDGRIVLWDGRTDDRLVNPGVYVYLMELIIDGKSQLERGHLTLMR